MAIFSATFSGPVAQHPNATPQGGLATTGSAASALDHGGLRQCSIHAALTTSAVLAQEIDPRAERM